MSREDFISDRLVDIRQRFRQSLDESGATPGKVTSLPSMRGSNENGENHRERRDLEGRLRRDTAQVSVLLEQSKQLVKETELFGKILEECLTGLLALGNGNQLPKDEYSKKVEELRIKYFSAFGRFSAFKGTDYSSDFNPHKSENTAPKLLPLILTIIGTGLLISIAIIISIRL